jgi:Long-chain acyl-CoA synthetases (AMP-forming)
MIKENFIQLFADSFKHNWDLPAHTNYGEEETLNYSQVAEKVARLHILFEQCGIREDDKIALLGRNSSNWAITYIATVTYGAIIVPILYDFNPNDIQQIANHSEVKLLFAEPTGWEKLDGSKLETIQGVFSLAAFDCLFTKNIDKETLITSNISALFEKKYPNGFTKDDIKYAKRDNIQLASINYTSGTTGFSKGVMCNGNALAGNIVFGLHTKMLVRHYRTVAFLPFAHAFGCAFDFLTATCAGCHIHFITKIPTPTLLLSAFAEVKPDTIFTVPVIIEKIYRKQIQPIISNSTVRGMLKIPKLNTFVYSKIKAKIMDAFGGNLVQIIIGGAALNPEAEIFFKKIKFPFTIGYGMTECAPLISYVNHKEFIASSVGKILYTMEAKIVNVNPETGNGELCVKGENLMDGYYKNPEATAETIDKEGWLHTGDLGTLDKDGNLFLHGRNKTMILGPSGQNIYPEEIEAKLNNMPFVLECLVVEDGGKIIALVYPDYEEQAAQNLSDEELVNIMEANRKHLNKLLASYEGVYRIVLQKEEFKKTPKNSIKRFLYQINHQNK